MPLAFVAATEAEAAKELAGERAGPTNAAWALNQLVRRHPMLVERFLLRSRELQLAQDRAVSGKGDALRDADAVSTPSDGGGDEAAMARCSETTPLTRTARRSLPRCKQRASTRKRLKVCKRVG